MTKLRNPAYFLGAVSICLVLVLATIDYWGHNPYVSTGALLLCAVAMIYSFMEMRRKID